MGFEQTYRLDAPFREFPHGSVWLGEERESGRRVLVTTVNADAPDAVRLRFEHVCEALEGVIHPHLLPVLWCGDGDHGDAIMVTAYPEGQLLVDRLSSQERPTVGALWDWAASLLDGLAAVHERGVVHGDVEPGWVLLCEQEGTWVPRLFGFGVNAVDVRAGAAAVGAGQEIAALRSLLYASPAAAQQPSSSPRDDLYSLGVLLYEALSGKYPYPHSTVAELRAAVASGEAPSLRKARPGVPRAAAEWVSQAMGGEGGFASATEMAAAARALLKATPTLVPTKARSAWRRLESMAPRSTPSRTVQPAKPSSSSGPASPGPRLVSARPPDPAATTPPRGDTTLVGLGLDEPRPLTPLPRVTVSDAPGRSGAPSFSKLLSSVPSPPPAVRGLISSRPKPRLAQPPPRSPSAPPSIKPIAAPVSQPAAAPKSTDPAQAGPPAVTVRPDPGPPSHALPAHAGVESEPEPTVRPSPAPLVEAEATVRPSPVPAASLESPAPLVEAEATVRPSPSPAASLESPAPLVEAEATVRPSPSPAALLESPAPLESPVPSVEAEVTSRPSPPSAATPPEARASGFPEEDLNADAPRRSSRLPRDSLAPVGTWQDGNGVGEVAFDEEEGTIPGGHPVLAASTLGDLAVAAGIAVRADPTPVSSTAPANPPADSPEFSASAVSNPLPPDEPSSADALPSAPSIRRRNALIGSSIALVAAALLLGWFGARGRGADESATETIPRVSAATLPDPVPQVEKVKTPRFLLLRGVPGSARLRVDGKRVRTRPLRVLALEVDGRETIEVDVEARDGRRWSRAVDPVTNSEVTVELVLPPEVREQRRARRAKARARAARRKRAERERDRTARRRAARIKQRATRTPARTGRNR